MSRSGDRPAFTIIADLLALVPVRNRERAERLAEELFGRGYHIGRQVTNAEQEKPEEPEDE